MWIFDFVLRIFWFFFAPKIFFLDSIIFPQKKFGDLTLSNIPPTNTTSSFSTTSTSSIPSTNRRSTGLHPYIYSRLWLFQMRTAASGTEAESICSFRTSLSFRVEQNIVPLVTKLKPSNCDKTQTLTLWQNYKPSNCDKTQKLKVWQKSKFPIVITLRK